MKYFLITGLMMMSSVAQANVCIPLWWEPATDVQVEIEAEYQGPLAMNDPCPDGRWPVELALENSRDPLVFAAILGHFELDEETRDDVIRFMTDIQRETLRLQGIQDEYREIKIKVQPGIEGNPTIHIRDTYNDSDYIGIQRLIEGNPTIHRRDTYDDSYIEIQRLIKGNPTIHRRDTYNPDTENNSDR